MNAFIVTISELLSLRRNGNHQQQDDFSHDIQRYLIPKYQREYKWGEDKVTTLLMDVASQSKFLGLITLEPKNHFYEIVDGQQRITTILLAFVALFNLFQREGQASLGAEQKMLLSFLQDDANRFILQNDTVGSFLTLSRNQINVHVDPSNDVFHQKETFERLYSIIEDKIKSFPDKIEFRNKLLDSKILILVSDETGYSSSIEQMYLDINDKLLGLDVEDIFKGFCFQNYNRNDHDTLKNQWVKLKTIGFSFMDFGYRDLSEYIYYYLLSCKEHYDIPKNLKVQNKHVLDGLDADQTQTLLDDMVSYGEHILSFNRALDQDTYRFNDILNNAATYPQSQFSVLRKMCKAIIRTPAAQFYKFPFFMLIHYLIKTPTLRAELSFDDLKKLITNYYLYAFFFLQHGAKKSRASIDRTIFQALYDNTPDRMKRVISAVQALRQKGQLEYEIPRNFNMNYSAPLYSVIDFYDAQSNFLPMIYDSLNLDTQEHLIIHQHRKKRVHWAEPGNEFDFDLNEIADVNHFRMYTINSLILQETINGALGHLDLVTKIVKLESHFSQNLPTHIAVFLQHIKTMESFQALKDLMGNHATQEEIKTRYFAFVEVYFSDDNQKQLHQRLTHAFNQALAGQRETALSPNDSLL